MIGNTVKRWIRNFTTRLFILSGKYKLLFYILELTKNIAKFFWRIPKYIKRTLLALQRDKQRRNNYSDIKNRYLIYTIYEHQSSLQDYKVIFLEALAKISRDVLIVVNGKLPQADINRLAQFGKVLERDNEGYDVAAFRHGIIHTGKEALQQYNQLILVNDTNIGPFRDLEEVFSEFNSDQLDFWGISMGEEQLDFTGYNPYGKIPKHLQSYFVVIENSLLRYEGFYDYWEKLSDTDSRNKAIGKHETVFAKYFYDRGFKYDALIKDTKDSALYIHPFKLLKQGCPLVKYSAFRNYDREQYFWHGLERESEIPDLMEYIAKETDYPIEVVSSILEDFKTRENQSYILIIDGVENIIPQCTRYRVLNKAEQLRELGYTVRVINNSLVQLQDAQFASHIIIYRSPFNDMLKEICRAAHIKNRPVYFDIDDLVFDTKFTDELEFTQGLSKREKKGYDTSVLAYKKMLSLCDYAITSTSKLKDELEQYKNKVILNRNVMSKELVERSLQVKKNSNDNKVKIGYFSGSITHNENFDLISQALLNLLQKYPQVELHIVGYLDIPKPFQKFKKQIVSHEYVDWRKLPILISQVDINLAPLVTTTFNEAKSEIKWIEAAAVKVVTVASNLGAFEEMIQDGVTGVLADDNEWESKLERLILEQDLREQIAENAFEFVMNHCTTANRINDFLKEELV
ncbi:TPA: rhamnan synthesis F family protein [Streptococcus suis]